MKKTFKIAASMLLWLGAAVGVVTLLVSGLAITGVVKPLVVSTGSMAPTFEAGAFILSINKPATEVKVGDVATVPRADGVLVTHRVSAIESTEGKLVTIRMKGDANKDQDVDPYAIESYGSPLVTIPGVGNIVAFLNNYRFITLSVAGGLLLIVLIWTSNTAKPEGKRSKKQEV